MYSTHGILPLLLEYFYIYFLNFQMRFYDDMFMFKESQSFSWISNSLTTTSIKELSQRDFLPIEIRDILHS